MASDSLRAEVDTLREQLGIDRVTAKQFARWLSVLWRDRILKPDTLIVAAGKRDKPFFALLYLCPDRRVGCAACGDPTYMPQPGQDFLASLPAGSGTWWLPPNEAIPPTLRLASPPVIWLCNACMAPVAQRDWLAWGAQTPWAPGRGANVAGPIGTVEN